MTPMEERLAKLMAMADHKDTNPNEAANAAAAAARLAAQHGIDLEELRTKSVSGGFMIMRSTWHFRKSEDVAVWPIVSWIARLFGTHCHFNEMPEEPNVGYVLFMGKKHAVELSHSWTKYLWESNKAAGRAHAAAMNYGSKEARQAARRDFRAHFSIQVAMRLREKLQAMSSDNLNTSDGRALTVVNHLEAEARAAEEWSKTQGWELREKTGIANRMPNFDTLAVFAGADAGRKVGLEDQIK